MPVPKIGKTMGLSLVVCIASSCFLAACVPQNSAGSATVPTSSANAGTGVERIDINTASAAELSRLPHIGPSLAEQIVEHRSRFGPFRKVEHIMLIQGISEKRFSSIKNFIKVEQAGE